MQSADNIKKTRSNAISISHTLRSHGPYISVTLVKSQLVYGREVWFSPNNSYLSKKIEGVQRRATLWILKKKREELSYKQRLTQLNLIPLVYDREQKDLIFFYKCMYGLTDFDISQYVEVTTGRTRAATSGLLRTQACKTSTFQSSYCVRIVKLWNYVCTSAPSYCYVTVSSFKSYLRKIYIHLDVAADT